METIESIRAKLTSIGASYHHKEKLETLERRYAELSLAVQPDRKKPIQKEEQEVIYPTQDEVLEAVQHYVARGMKVDFNDDGFLFTYGQKQDSGTLKQPLDVIKRCALYLTRG